MRVVIPVMDKSEAIAATFLKKRFGGNLVYEPIPNSTPDFLLNDRFAIEVTTLFQYTESSEPPYNDAVAIHKLVQTSLDGSGKASHEAGWYLIIEFNRPLNFKKLRRELPRAFLTTNISTISEGQVLYEEHGVQIRALHPRPENKAGHSIGVFIDGDSGGQVAPEMKRAFDKSLERKNSNAQAHRGDYSEWWLVLIDRISLTIAAEEFQSLYTRNNYQHIFDRIFLLHPEDEDCFFELTL